MTNRFRIFFPGVVADRLSTFRIPEAQPQERLERFGELATLEETRSDQVSPYIPGGRVRFFDRIQLAVAGELVYEFPIDPMVDVAFQKRVKETEIVYQDRYLGEVTEIISPGSARITLRGLLIGANGAYPYEDLARLQAMYDRNESLEVSSRYFTALGIQNIVLTELEHVRTEGYPDTHGYRLTGRSDAPVELLIGEDLLPRSG